MLKNILLLLAVLITAAFLSTCGTSEAEYASGQQNQTEAAAQTNAVSFAFSVPDVTGTPQPMSQWVGTQPTVINFWGTWCPPCRREIPDLIRLYGEYKNQGVEIVSLAVRDHPQKVQAFTDQMRMDWVQLIATEQSAKVFGLTGSVPTTIFYDRNGNEVARFVGARNYETFKKAFEEITAI
jgi:thiol-disulfide isomerase/thioredoxin